MEQFYILDKLNTRVEMEQVLKFLDCTSESPVYEEFVEEYREMEGEIASLVQGRGILGFGQLSEAVATGHYPSGTNVLYAVITVGDGASKASTEAFREGNYVRGMLWDAIADMALISLEDVLHEKVHEICNLHHVGIEKRLEAPRDIPMEVQRDAWETLKLNERMGINISSGFMLDPVKSSCQVFVLTEDVKSFKVYHDCRNCSNVSCKLRNIPNPEITVKRKEAITRFTMATGESLMEGLLREGFYISAVCAGKGRCGKCKVRVLAGEAAVTSEDKKFFSDHELAEGWRLSCLLYPTEDLTIAFDLNDESEFEAVSGFGLKCPDEKRKGESRQEQEACNIAIDIGTTTIAFQLLSLSGQVLQTVTAINSQRKYGADVISRIQASVDGKKAELQNNIRKDLQQGITALLESGGKDFSLIKKISIACNTTMSHLLMGYDCESLGLYPFTPVNIDFIRGSTEEIMGFVSNAEVVILPGISTYVGGDIVSGLYACGFHDTDEISLLVDLGTNGEMAVGNRERLLVASTAAGPAFEGGNLTWGKGSVAGAICSVRIEEGKIGTDLAQEGPLGICLPDGRQVYIETIKGKAPVGICGTGVVEAISEMLREGIIDEMGLLDEEYFEVGFPLAITKNGEQIVITQKDIRELQLAKAAVRAGIETLCLRYGVAKEQVSKVYLAGGFGYRLDAEKAMAIGMLPEEFAGKIEAVGNSSLAGAGKFLWDALGVKSLENASEPKEILQKIVSISEEIGLSTDKDFNELYMEHMMFE